MRPRRALLHRSYILEKEEKYWKGKEGGGKKKKKGEDGEPGHSGKRWYLSISFREEGREVVERRRGRKKKKKGEREKKRKCRRVAQSKSHSSYI